MNITGRQIRGARALLGWKMEELADKAGITRITVRQIESEMVQPQERTLTKIFGIFDKHGIEFLPNEGLQVRKQETRTYSGKAGYRQLLDHMYETMKDGGNIRQFNFGDMRYAPFEEPFVDDHIKRMEDVEGLDARVLEVPGETLRPVSYCTYRTMDKKFRDMAPWYLYGDYVVLSLFEGEGKKEFITVQSKLLASRYLKEFDIFWKMSTPSPKKKAK